MFRTLVARLRQYGPLETAFLGLRWAGLLAETHSLEFFIRDLERDVSQSVGSPRDSMVECDELLPSDLPHARLADGLPTKEWAEQQFARGSRLFAARHGDLTVAWSWLNTKEADLTFIRKPAVALPAGVAYGHGVIVDPAYQGQGIGGIVKAFGCGSLANEGFRHVVAAVFLSNRRAIEWHGRVLGEQYWGRITHVRVNRTDHWLKFLAPAGREQPHLFDATADRRK